MRVFSDEPVQVGDELELDLLPPGDSPIRVWTRVAWVEELPAGADACYEVGLHFSDIADEDRQRLASVLDRIADGRPATSTGDA
jgi:hypothetical protein